MEYRKKVGFPPYKTEIVLDVNDSKTASVYAVDGNGNRLHYLCVALILVYELIKSFSFHGVRSILIVYLTKKLNVSTPSAMMIYHGFSALTYCMCIFGGVLADRWLGKYKSIQILSVVNTGGALLLMSGSLPAMHSMAHILTTVGLLIIAVGYGGIMPCVTAFGGDQFVQPAQSKRMIGFFAIFYFILSVGMVFAILLMPILMSNISCFGGQCYALVFLLPAVIMCVSLLLLAGGHRVYRNQPPAGKVVMLVFRGIADALWCGCSSEKRAHWLDQEQTTYGQTLIDDVRDVLATIFMFVPLTIFWVVFEQHGPRWTIQATKMAGEIGPITIQPEQMQLLNPLLLLLLIPLCHLVIYPVLALLCICRPLSKIAFGCLLVCLAFVVAGLLDGKKLDRKTYFRVYNPSPCDYIIKCNVPGFEEISVNSMGMYEHEHVPYNGNFQYTLVAKQIGPLASRYGKLPRDVINDYCPPVEGSMQIVAGKSNNFFNIAKSFNRLDDIIPVVGKSVVRILANYVCAHTVRRSDNNALVYAIDYGFAKNVSSWITEPGKVNLQFETYYNEDITLLSGHAITVLVTAITVQHYYLTTKLDVAYAQNNARVHMLWQVPQYVLLTLGEVMIVITCLSYAYKEAPASMKTVVLAFFFLTIAVGHMAAFCLIGLRNSVELATEFFILAGLMFFGMVLFMGLAYRYIPRKRRAARPVVLVN